MLKKLSIFALTTIFTTVVHAEVKPVFKLGFEGGGDALVETSVFDLYAGGGAYFGAGVNISSDQSPLGFQVTLGYLTDSVEFILPSGESSISTMPLDISVVSTHGAHSFGGGISYHINPSWELCFYGSGCTTVDFDSSMGVSLQYFWTNPYSGFGLGAKFTSIEYEGIDASSVGLYLGTGF